MPLPLYQPQLPAPTTAAPRVMTFGLIVGNRGFFPQHLAERGRQDMLAALKADGYNVVVLDAADSRHGVIESRDEAKACAALFRSQRDVIDGVIVTLPNFGDERAVAETLRMAELNVPVLIHATADAPDAMTIRDRRDSFCGKISVCNVLSQYGIKYSLTTRHTDRPRQQLSAPTCRSLRPSVEW